MLAFWPCPRCCSLIFFRCQNSWSICWLLCRSCGSRERRSDLGMMMTTQKKLLVSGIRWQEGKRRKGKPSSLVFEQTFLFFSLWLSELSKTVYQAISSGFFFQNYIWNLAVCEGKTYFSSSPATNWAWPILVPWDQFSFQGHHQTPSPLDLEAAVVRPCSFMKCSVKCSFCTAAACPTIQSHWVHLESYLLEEREEEVKKKWLSFHSTAVMPLPWWRDVLHWELKIYFA